MTYNIIRLNMAESTFEILYGRIPSLIEARDVFHHAIRCDKSKNDVILIMPVTVGDGVRSAPMITMEDSLAAKYKVYGSKYNIISLGSGGDQQ